MIRDGIINVDKPQNMTSHDVVRDLRRLLGIKRIGHTGTLDPMATGVLPICIGSATRITEYLDLDMKKYRCTMVLGIVTDTQDIWGEVIEKNSADCVTEENIRIAFQTFSGIIDQKPPMYSAVRVNGRRLYDYARAGESVQVKTRKVFIKELIVEKVDMSAKEVTFTVECSKGTYIRTICEDVGKALGTGAALTALKRLASGIFTVDSAIDLDTLKTMTKEEIESILLPQDFPLVHFGKAVVNYTIGKKFVDGWHVALTDCRIEKEPEYKTQNWEMEIRPEYRYAYNIYKEDEKSHGGQIFLGVAFYSDKYKKLVADKVFFRGQENEDF